MRPYDARAVANFLLDLADEHEIELTQLGILKIIYFCHGWFLAVEDAPLVKNDFEAWQYGPVIKVVRDAFQQFGKRPITTRAKKLDVYTGEKVLVQPILSAKDRLFIQNIFKEYCVYSAWHLAEMTHEQGSPWDKVWNPQTPSGRIGLRIKNDEIKAHFAAMTRRGRLS